MNKNTVIQRIIYLPEEFKRIQNTSIYNLLKESGYFELYNEINEINIIKEIVSNPQCVKQWLNWSEDKRSSSGWYFKQNEEGKYIVGYFPSQQGFKVKEYSDIKEACAAFIKLELENIRNTD